jgi:hypothetical protein
MARLFTFVKKIKNNNNPYGFAPPSVRAGAYALFLLLLFVKKKQKNKNNNDPYALRRARVSLRTKLALKTASKGPSQIRREGCLKRQRAKPKRPKKQRVG